jgi:hypothetical protein
LHNSPKIVHKKQKINETPLSRGINFLYARTQRNHSQKRKIYINLFFGLLKEYISQQKFTEVIFQ